MSFALAANISLLFAELPYLDRIDAAAAAGFDSVETWWPFDSAVPPAAEVDAFVGRLQSTGMPLTGLNLFAGDMARGERGVLSSPSRRTEVSANLEVVAGIAQRTGCRGFNSLYGQREPGIDPDVQDEIAVSNYAAGVRRCAEFGGTLYVEALARGLNGAYPLETADDAARVVERVRSETGLDNIGVLFDTFHLASNGHDLPAVIAEHSSLIAHVQLADAPGRGEPGTGEIDFAAVLDALWNAGYRGGVAAEYRPSTASTLDGLGWIDTVPHLEVRDATR